MNGVFYPAKLLIAFGLVFCWVVAEWLIMYFGCSKPLKSIWTELKKVIDRLLTCSIFFVMGWHETTNIFQEGTV